MGGPWGIIFKARAGGPHIFSCGRGQNTHVSRLRNNYVDERGRSKIKASVGQHSWFLNIKSN